MVQARPQAALAQFPGRMTRGPQIQEQAVGEQARLGGPQPGQHLTGAGRVDGQLLQDRAGTVPAAGLAQGSVVTAGPGVGVAVDGVNLCERGRIQEPGRGRDDVWLACLPLCYIAGCAITVLAALQARATLVLCDFDPGLVLSLIESERATVILLAAAMVQMLLEHEDLARRDLSSLRLVCVGGSAIAPELARQAQAALGVPMTVMYGLTEACGIVAQTRIEDPEEDRVQTIGRPHPHVEVKIIDPWRGGEVPAGAAGELVLRGYFVMDGYLDLPEATREAIDPDRWLHTGDLATLDDRGYLQITGRLKEIINRGARKIAPGEIEALLTSHPAVALTAVIGVPDQRLGEEIAAFVRLAPDATVTENELARLCAEQLAPFKRPRHWIFLDEMPLTRSGKVHKPALRDIFDARRG